MTKPVTRKLAVDCLLHAFLYRQAQFICDDGSMPNLMIRAYLTCAICNGSLQPGEDIEFDHVHADVFGGPHDYRNLRPLHADCHKAKTAQDIKANAKVKRLANPKPSKHPMKPSGRKLQSRPFAKRVK